MSPHAKANLALEASAGCLHLAFVLLVGLMGLLGVNWIAIELLTLVEMSGETGRILFSPQTVLAVFAILVIPTVILGLAIVGTRVLLVHPEPPPWIDEDE